MSIKLTLVNFKKYESKTVFTLPANGLVLLQGPSGIGKTSILDAIYFVLFGMGSKIVNFNASNCSVTWEQNGIIITRTKKPNRLTLKERETIYEDAVAQEIINSRYGTNFEITSYIKYKASTSFMSLGPSAKMEFLQKIAIKGADVQMLKTKTKEKIRIRKERLLQLSSELNLVRKELESLEIPDVVKFPFGKYNETKIKNHKIRSKNIDIKLSNAEKLLKKTIKEHNKRKLQEQTNTFINNKIHEYDQESVKLREQLSSVDYTDTTELKNIASILEKNKLWNTLTEEISNMKKQYEEYKEIEDCKRIEELERLKSIPKIEDKTEEYKDNILLKNNIISTTRRLQESIREYESYTNVNMEVLEDLNKQLENSLNKKYNCPGCKCTLLLKNDKLYLYDDNEGKIIDNQELKNMIKSTKEKLHKKSILQCSIEKDKKFLQTHENFDLDINYEDLYKENYKEIQIQNKNLQEIKRLSIKTYSPSLIKLEKEIQIKKKRLDSCKHIQIDSPYTDIQELKDLINKYEMNNHKYDTISNRIKEIHILIEKERDKIITLEDIDYDEKIKNIESEIRVLNDEKSINKKLDEQLGEYIKYKEKRDNYDKWETRLKNLQCTEKNHVKSLEVAEQFLTLVNNTESRAVTNIINSLNIHLKYYSEQFFTEPMIIQVQPFKESVNGNVKPSVNIKISYKGMDYDIDCLSGGETSRVELAICLSINNIINGKILLLDEVLGTLNAGYIDTITDILKDEALKTGKLILTILHGASEGNFDTVINIE